MLEPLKDLIRDTFSGANRRGTIVLLTSAVCLAAWYGTGSYNFWMEGLGSELWAAVGCFATGVVLLGIVPLLVVKLVLRERLAGYGVQLGNLQFAIICSVLAAPLLVWLGYSSAQLPA